MSYKPITYATYFFILFINEIFFPYSLSFAEHSS